VTLEVTIRAAGPIPIDAAFEVRPGEMLALVGPSGAGKTTLLRCIAGLWHPGAGRVAVDGEIWLDTAAGVDLPAHRRRVGVVFQSYALFPHMSAAENVMAAMARGAPGRRAEAERLLALVGLERLAARRPARLSGGQQQRVALARALARKPAVLLLDEPFSAVDGATRARLHDELVALRAHLAMPVVLVTHDMNEAQMLADRMAVIDRGLMLRTGSTAEVMADAQALRALGLRELSAMLPATIATQEADGLTRLQTSGGPLWLPRIDGAPGTALRLRILAHEVILSRRQPEGLSAQNVLPGKVIEIRPGEGPGAIVRIRAGRDEILARVTRRAVATLGLMAGQEVYAIIESLSVARSHVVRGPGRAPD